jgi:hypothetical protein
MTTVLAALIVGQFFGGCPGGNCYQPAGLFSNMRGNGRGLFGNMRGNGNGLFGMQPDVTINKQTMGVREGIGARLFGNAGPYAQNVQIGIGRGGVSALNGGSYGGGYSSSYAAPPVYYEGGYSSSYAAPSVSYSEGGGYTSFAAPSVQSGGCYSSSYAPSSYSMPSSYASPQSAREIIIVPQVERIPTAEPGPPPMDSSPLKAPAIWLEPPQLKRVRTVIVLPPQMIRRDLSKTQVAQRKKLAPKEAPRLNGSPSPKSSTLADRLLARFDALDQGVADINRSLASRGQEIRKVAENSDRLEQRIVNLEAWVHRNDPPIELYPAEPEKEPKKIDHANDHK